MSTQSYFDSFLAKLSPSEEPDQVVEEFNFDNKTSNETIKSSPPRRFLNQWDDFQSCLDRIQNDIQREIQRAEEKFNELRQSVRNMENEFIQTTSAKLDELIPSFSEINFKFP